MGADLMIRPLFTANYVKHEPNFRHWVRVRDELLLRGDTRGADIAQRHVASYLDEMYRQGYFRDYYNSVGLLYAFGMSWKDDVAGALTNKQGKMRSRRARQLLKLLAEREPEFELNLRSRRIAKGESRANVTRHYHRRYAQLKRFLGEAIDRRMAITCSL